VVVAKLELGIERIEMPSVIPMAKALLNVNLPCLLSAFLSLMLVI
jgi:hypothetical protein